MFADMENFSFDRTPRPTQQPPRQTRERTRSVSPCSSAAMAAAMPDSRFTLTDLAAQFAGQRLRRDAQICYDSCDRYANLDDDVGWQIEVDDAEEDDEESFDPSSLISSCPIGAMSLTRRRTCLSRPHSPSQRTQRQANARLLCSTTHHRDIADLVSKMVKSQDQCRVTNRSDLSTSSSTLSLASATSSSTDPDEDALDDDEGYDSGSNSTSTSRRTSTATRSSSSTSLSTMSMAGFSRPRSELYRRASDRRHASGASVCKSARFRRETRVSHSRQ